MNEFDDLDVLEREFGPSLRVALRRVAEDIADTSAPDADWLNRIGIEPVELDTPEPERSEVLVFDVERAQRTRTSRRRLVAAAAAVAAGVIIAGTVIVQQANDDITVEDPGDPVPTTPPDTSAQVFLQSLLPPEGLPPSTPEAGELVGAIAFSRFIDFPGSVAWHDSAIHFYADGRVIWSAISDVPGGIAEQRLTPAGVDRIRWEFLAAQMFESEQPPIDARIWTACACIVNVRDGDRLLSSAPEIEFSAEPAVVDPELERRVDNLVQFVTNLTTHLPASAWADREVTPYVPSRYRVCVRGEDAFTNTAPLPDPDAALARVLPAPVAQLLAGVRPCDDFTMAETRALMAGLVDANRDGVVGVPSLAGQDDPIIMFQTWAPRYYVVAADRGSDPPRVAITIALLLPDGEPMLETPG